MSRRNLIVVSIIAVIGLTVVPFAYAQVGRMHHAGGVGFPFLAHLGHLKAELNLSDEQVGQITSIAKDFHQQNAQNRDQLHGGLKAVAQTLINNPNDIAAAQALLDQQTAVEKTMKSNALVAASKALNVLTADQRAKLGQIMSEHMAEHAR
jgi:Spy/CpxP family protein refolding chaperone